MDTISDVCDFIRAKLTNDESYQHRRHQRRKTTKSDIRFSSQYGHDLRNGRQINLHKHRSSSLPQANLYQLNDNSKRPSSETLISSQLNSRRQSKTALNTEGISHV